MAKSWTAQDTGYLKRYAAGKTLDDLVQRFEAEPDEVRAKLAELELTTKDGEPAGAAHGPDPMVQPFEKAMEALYSENWKKAVELLDEVVEGSDQPELTARARQLRGMAAQRLDQAGDEATPYLRAVVAKNRGRLDEALEIAGSESKDDGGRFAYLRASIHALRNETDEAVAELETAREADPRHTVNAFHDPDFTELRKDKDYAYLFGLE